MEKILTQFANSGASEKADLLGSLGIDWTLLALQTVAEPLQLELGLIVALPDNGDK